MLGFRRSAERRAAAHASLAASGKGAIGSYVRSPPTPEGLCCLVSQSRTEPAASTRERQGCGERRSLPAQGGRVLSRLVSRLPNYDA